MSSPSKKLINFDFEDGVSSKGTPLKYIVVTDTKFRFSEDQKKTLKEICGGYFFYSKTKQEWGFTVRGNNELNVYNYLKHGTIPKEVISREASRNAAVRNEPIPFEIDNFDIKFVELKGRPLFYFENVGGIIEIAINLKHWFFEKHDSSEKEFARKIALSLVGTELEFTSQLIESYFVKLNIIQENLKYEYRKHKP